MNINRHNYEEFFILYMDNELSSEDRRMVEAFVQNHPDLKEELDTLFQFKLEPDATIVFAGKEELMKVKGESPVTLSNYEEWLVLYMDNELTADQRNKVEQFITANPSVKKEVDLLLRTQLQPETIVFANKEVLYRKEEKVRPILWWRAAAAILILALGITSVIVFNKKGNTGKDEIAKAPQVKEKTTTENVVINNPKANDEVRNEDKQTPIPVIANNVQEAVAITIPVNTTANKKNNIAPVKTNENTITPVKKNEETLAVNNNDKQTNNLPQPLQNRNVTPNNAGISNATDVATNNNSKPIINSNPSLTNSKVTNPSAQPSDYVNTSFDPNKNSDEVLDQPNGKKSKLRGFFRKVTRTFEKRTNIDPTEDDKLLVGGLAIRLK